MSTIVDRITKGEWFSCCTDKKPHFAFSHEGTVTICGFHQEQQMSDDLSLEEVQANAILIADAGTTANKCGKLPSELLESNNEMLEFLKKYRDNYFSENGSITGANYELFTNIIQKNTR